MATRLFLTMLALLAGLAAQFTPAQARGGVAVDIEIGATTSVAAGQRQATSRIAVAHARQPRDRYVGAGSRAIALRPAIFVPTVLQGIDRARE